MQEEEKIVAEEGLAEEEKTSDANWYVVHTYSGYENKVKANIEKTIENRHLEEEILEVRVPMEEVSEIKNGVRKTVQRKMFPGYVLVNMVMNDDTWYVVRNTRGVTGFVGPGSKPVPLSEAEMKPLGIRTGIMSGSACPVHRMQQVFDRMFMKEVTNPYGLTESGPVMTMTNTASFPISGCRRRRLICPSAGTMFPMTCGSGRDMSLRPKAMSSITSI